MYPATHYQNGLCKAQPTPEERKVYGIKPLRNPRKEVQVDKEGKRVKPTKKPTRTAKVRNKKERAQAVRAKQLWESELISTLSTDPDQPATENKVGFDPYEEELFF